MNKIIRYIGHFIGEIPFIGKIKPWALKYVNPWEKKHRNRIFLQRGLKTIGYFDKLMSDNQIPYSLVFGTLLGAIREHGFIKHDLDIDVAIWHEVDNMKIQNILTGSGFKLIRRFETDKGSFGREETYLKNGVTIDLFYFYPYEEDGLSYTTVIVPFDGFSTLRESIDRTGGGMPIQLILPFTIESERIQFHNLKLPVMVNAINFLEARYGKNWRIPDPTFVYPKMGDAKCNYRSDKKAILTFEDK